MISDETNPNEKDPGADQPGKGSAASPDALSERDTETLGVLNRHWYRRCLDRLNETLLSSPLDPSVEDVRELCENIIQGFLTSITGQAPDSDQLQFPADRVYYIPFADDFAGRWNYSKPFYRFAGNPTPDQKKNGYRYSLWSFFPWAKGQRVRIDSTRSVDEKQETIAFEQMVSIGAQFAHTTEETKGDNSEKAKKGVQDFLLQKSILGRQDYVLNAVFSDTTFKSNLRKSCEKALKAVYEIYRSTPGNAAVEHILNNHVNLICWLTAMADNGGSDESFGQLEDAYKRIFRAFLRSVFLAKTTFGKEMKGEGEQFIQRLSALLLKQEDMEETGVEASNEDTGKEDVSEEAKGSKGSGSEEESLLKFFAEQRGSQYYRERIESKENQRLEDRVSEFKDYITEMGSFGRYLLAADVEARFESELGEALGENLPKAGETAKSFVWVVTDFAQVEANLPKQVYRLTEEKSKMQRVIRSASLICDAYQAFFRQCDRIILKDKFLTQKVRDYWRTQGEVNRRRRVFSSFPSPSAGLYTSELAVQRPRPQNFFLRAKICDSLNEPMINGLFVITTDHDEVAHKGKKPEIRLQDRDDLLAFAKVYFFIVRDFLRFQDRAQEARDIGKLNQHLYDERLVDLDARTQYRVQTKSFLEKGLGDESNWPLFVYEVLNNYANSLIRKPPEVKTETFPFDRLFVLPLAGERRSKPTVPAQEDVGPDEQRQQVIASSFDLPLYLFQSIFVERKEGLVDRWRYSLLKPYQSPIEGLADERFSKSFQSAAVGEDREVELDRYLEKLYLSGKEDGPEVRQARRGFALDSSQTAPDQEPESFVVKLFDPVEAGGKAQVENGSAGDRGALWVQEAISTFWRRHRSGPFWEEFLRGLTLDYRTLRDREEDQDLQTGPLEHWFLLRFGLLRLILDYVAHEDRTGLSEIRRAYRDDLRLRFDNQTGLDVFALAESSDSDPYVRFFDTLKLVPKRAATDVEFVQFRLGGEGTRLPHSDDFVLKFFSHLTDLAASRQDLDKSKKWKKSETVTWCQPVLTRPYEKSDLDRLAVKGLSEEGRRHRAASEAIGPRAPQYGEISEGRDALAMFIGYVNCEVGKGANKSLIRCLIAMIRDYDDRQTGAGLTPEEVERQLEVDKRDLSLFTSTFFRNVQKFGSDTIAREEIRVLSTDIQQIARNWYSSGLDLVTASLSSRLDRLRDDRRDLKLGRLRPELLEEFCDSTLRVLVLPQEKPTGEGEEILLESFPFDRMLHMTLSLDDLGDQRLFYARTFVRKTGTEAGGVWPYEKFRRIGRIWPRYQREKVAKVRLHFGPDSKGPKSEAGPQDLNCYEDLRKVLSSLHEPRILDAFVRGLYEANALQTLAVAGLAASLLRNLGAKNLPLEVERYRAILDRLDIVIHDSVRSVEQSISQEYRDVLTAAHMDRAVRLPVLSGLEGSALATQIRDTSLLPAWFEFFKAAERGEAGFEYGLLKEGQTVDSKVFYVYYSFDSPISLSEVPRDGRFRGVFVFVVDDSSTDLKDPAGEIADQQDIRTFVHNSVRGLRLILDSQGWENRLRQPGIDQFILGMLHRVKNELGQPVRVLHQLREREELAGSTQVVEQIKGANDVIYGLQDLFKGLKGLNEIGQGVVPLQSFSSDWLGWLFIIKLCSAAQNLGQKIEAETKKSHLDQIKKIKERANRELKDDASSARSVDLIQRTLRNLETPFKELAALSVPADVDQDVILSFQVFSDKSLEFTGSFLLDEALNVLIENAFQAFWAYMIGDTGNKRQGILKLVCRRSDPKGQVGDFEENENEIVLEVTNSSRPTDPTILKALNSHTPQPLTKQQHQTLSGKKGGSGFGHYYARQIVSRYCGGPEERANLDVRINFDHRESVAKVHVNLLESARTGVNPVSAKELESVIFKTLGKKVTLATEANGARYYFPSVVRLDGLMDLSRRILGADRQRLEERLFDFFKKRVCQKLAENCDRTRKELQGILKKGAGKSKAANWKLALGMLEENGFVKTRRSSFHDLKKFVELVRRLDADFLKKVVAKSELLNRYLGDFLENGELLPDVFVKEHEALFNRHFNAFTGYMKRKPDFSCVQEVLKDLSQNERGFPEPSRKSVNGLLLPARGSVLHQFKAPDNSLHLAISLSDGDGEVDHSILGLKEPGTETGGSILKKFPRFGQTFRSYSRSFERASLGDEESIGRLWIELDLPEPGERGKTPRRTVHLTLRNLTESGEAQPENEPS